MGWQLGLLTGDHIFSTTIAFPVMRDTMLAAYDGRAETPFARPADVVVKQTCAAIAQLPTNVRAPGAVVQAPVPTVQSCGTDLGVR